MLRRRPSGACRAAPLSSNESTRHAERRPAIAAAKGQPHTRGARTRRSRHPLRARQLPAWVQATTRRPARGGVCTAAGGPRSLESSNTEATDVQGGHHRDAIASAQRRHAPCAS
eukprot:scaffold215768_cov31-Tisochrysis_lutea.AAC.1